MLNKFKNISDDNLKKVIGGGRADYNNGYRIGQALSNWWHSRFL